MSHAGREHCTCASPNKKTRGKLSHAPSINLTKTAGVTIFGKNPRAFD